MRIARAIVLLAALVTLACGQARAADGWFTTSDGVRLHYIEAGPAGQRTARTVVLVPGWTMPAWIFSPQIVDLSRKWHVVALDPRGQGQSDIPAGGYDQDRRGQDIAELIQHVSVGPVVLVGWSLGVLDSLAYIHNDGDAAVAALVLVDNSVGEDPPPTPSRRPTHASRRLPRETVMRNFVRGMFRRPPPPAYLEQLTDDCLRTPERVAEELLSYPVPRTYWKAAVYSTSHPVLYVVRPGLAGQAENLRLHDPAAESVVLQGVGHALFVDDPGTFNSLVTDFNPPARLAVTPAPSARGGGALLPLFLVSLASLGFEIALTRYFAVAKWSEYGYWVISIVLAGFALSGVVLALARDFFARHGRPILAWLPAALIVAAAAGFHLVTTNPFNPLQLQNQATYAPQLWNIGGYYVSLLPFFFLTGLFVSLNFILNPSQIGRVYGFDLTGAGAGALAVLGLMALVHPFQLVPYLLVPLALAAVPRRMPLLAALLALAAGEALLLGDNEAAFNDFKAIYAPLHVPDSKTLAEIRSPRGLYMLLDDFTERVDTDVSNNAGMLGLPGPPTTLGLYRDGNRIAALPKPPGATAAYAGATLAALPYQLLPKDPRVLLAGASGGFRIAEARALGAADVLALEPEPILRSALRDGLGGVPAFPADPAVRISNKSPIAATATGQTFDLIDISGDFLDAGEANASAFAAEALAADLRALTPDGLVSIPVSIREFPAYAVRMLATARAALLATGIADPGRNVLVYRSAWNVRILLSPAPFDAARIAAAKKWCDDRSFDILYYPGIDVAAARADIYNDLPAVSFEAGEVTSGDGAHDAIADEAGAVLAGQETASSRSFNLSPITFDRPAYYAVLRLGHLGTLLRRLELLPQAEIGPIVNLAVLAQAVVIAVLVLAVPLFGRGRIRAPGVGTLRAAVYFAALGLGFLFIEIFFIERASFYLNDRTSAFALVLTSMLIFSGLGAMLASRVGRNPRRGILLAGGVVVAWCAVMLVSLQPLLLATLGLPWLLRAGIVLALLAPVSVALGLPFPLGLARTGSGPFLPWAWALNGAFSVVSTPLANLIAVQQGYDGVLLLALLLYLVCIIAFPSPRTSRQWQDASAP